MPDRRNLVSKSKSLINWASAKLRLDSGTAATARCEGQARSTLYAFYVLCIRFYADSHLWCDERIPSAPSSSAIGHLPVSAYCLVPRRGAAASKKSLSCRVQCMPLRGCATPPASALSLHLFQNPWWIPLLSSFSSILFLPVTIILLFLLHNCIYHLSPWLAVCLMLGASLPLSSPPPS